MLEANLSPFFRRVAEGVFDQADLALRTGGLADFLGARVEERSRDPANIGAVGFSHGAKIPASLLLRQPGLLHRAILFRAMAPFEPARLSGLVGTRTLLGEGRLDPIVPIDNAERLVAIPGAGGGEVTLDRREAGHPLEPREIDDVRRWLAEE